ncbi:DUF4197 domain-containing protein [Novosphingobium colocasiae]|nr:DUF4197 domain-containing protein [Novosphingobium colocasiae]
MSMWAITQGAGSAAINRRTLLAGFAATGALALGGCATIGQTSYTEAVRRLLTLATQRAFAQLTRPDGFWDSTVARVELPVLFGKPGKIASVVLKSPAFREKLQHSLNRFAEDGARRAAPVAADALRSLTFTDALALLKGGGTGATTYFRQAMGPGLVNAMIPALGDAMQVANDPVLNQAIALLSGVNLGDAAHALALNIDNAIWYQIGEAEADIRRDPQSTNDPLLIAALKVL